jgi:diguanylate cyclase (GGDEF)-like protein
MVTEQTPRAGFDVWTSGHKGRDVLRIAIVGGGEQGTQLLELLRDVPHVIVAGFCDRDSTSVGMRRANQSGIFVTTEIEELYQIQGLDILVDATGNPDLRDRILRTKPTSVELVGERGSELVWDLLRARRRGEEQERLFAEVQVAYERIRAHERELQTRKTELERANIELENRLAEIFFTHEFFKALASYQSVGDVCSLIVDGANGILGAEIACVYLMDLHSRQLLLAGSQGRPASHFSERLDMGESLVGRVAAERRPIMIPETAEDDPDLTWSLAPDQVKSQVGTVLQVGDKMLGVLVIASSQSREYTTQEMGRIDAICNMSSLALQNALLHEELERLSVTDRLTDLYNHGYFQQRLEEEIARADRFSHDVSLVMMDIDFFKDFNDTYGHPRGDVVLTQIAQLVKDSMREVDVAARYGGEEFVVILPETDAKGALQVAERIRAGAEEGRFEGLAGEMVRKTVSIGVATYPANASTQPELIEAADQAMYAAKRSGRNCVRVADGPRG